MTDRNLYLNPDPSMAGQPYQPADHIDALLFTVIYCRHCKPESCEIIKHVYEMRRPIMGNGVIPITITNPEYPKEWVYRADGQPTCTAFEEET